VISGHRTSVRSHRRRRIPWCDTLNVAPNMCFTVASTGARPLSGRGVGGSGRPFSSLWTPWLSVQPVWENGSWVSGARKDGAFRGEWLQG